MPHKAGNGAILGIASEDGKPSQKRIVLMDRTNLSVVAKTTSDNDGAYAFNGLNPDTDDYLIFAVDDDGNPTKAAIIYDKVRPISAHMGGFYWANWYLQSMAKEPLVHFLGIESGGVLTGGAGRAYFEGQGAALLTNQPTLTPAASNLPSTTLNSISIGRYTLNQHHALSNQANTTASVEWVLDLNSIKQNCSIVLTRNHSSQNHWGNYSYGATILLLRYNYQNKKLQLYRHNGVHLEWNDNLFSNTVLCCEYDVAMLEGVVHIAGSIIYGENAQLYVNGVQVATANLAGSNIKSGFYDANMILILAFCGDNKINGSNTLGFPVSMTTGVAAAYGSAMGADEAMAHYKALMIESIPIATGYFKAVVQDYPTYLYRLNDIQESLVVKDGLRPTAQGNGHELIKVGNMQAVNDSLVKGGGGMVFSGGGVRSNQLHLGVHNPYYLSIEFIAKPDSQTVNNWQMLISHEINGNIHFEVRRHNTTGRWCVQWRENNAEYLANFNTPVDVSQMHHYVFTVDKITGQCLLYIDGDLTETLNITKLKMNVGFSLTIEAESLSIGGRVNSGLSSVAYPYYGYLAEVAIYPFALNPTQISDHIQAMSIL